MTCNKCYDKGFVKVWQFMPGDKAHSDGAKRYSNGRLVNKKCLRCNFNDTSRILWTGPACKLGPEHKEE